MEIVDVTFNFEQLEEIIVNKRKDCDEVCVQIADIMVKFLIEYTVFQQWL